MDEWVKKTLESSMAEAQKQAQWRVGKATLGLHRGRADGRSTPFGWQILAGEKLVISSSVENGALSSGLM
jgi:hypothetical protein